MLVAWLILPSRCPAAHRYASARHHGSIAMRNDPPVTKAVQRAQTPPKICAPPTQTGWASREGMHQANSLGASCKCHIIPARPAYGTRAWTCCTLIIFRSFLNSAANGCYTSPFATCLFSVGMNTMNDLSGIMSCKPDQDKHAV